MKDCKYKLSYCFKLENLFISFINSCNYKKETAYTITIFNVTTKSIVAEIQIEKDEYFASNSQYLVTYNRNHFSLQIFKIINGQVFNNYQPK